MSKFRVRITGVSPAAAAMLGGLAAGLLCQAVAAAPAQKKPEQKKPEQAIKAPQPAAASSVPLSLGTDIARLGPAIKIAVGKSTLRSLTRPVSQIAVNDPKVAGARMLGTSSEL